MPDDASRWLSATSRLAAPSDATDDKKITDEIGIRSDIETKLRTRRQMSKAIGAASQPLPEEEHDLA